MSMMEIEEKVYDDGRTKQSFKDSTDINKMLNKAQQTGSLAHLNKYPEKVYGEFDGEFDLLTAQKRIERANEIFGDLPSEVRKEFNNNALDFVRFAGNPANNDKLRDLLPALAEPGKYFPNPVQRGGQGAGAATTPSEIVADGAPASPPPEVASESAPPTGDAVD
jgi:hypothetical protein